MQLRVIVVTDPPTHTHTYKHTDRTDYKTLHHRLACSVNIEMLL